MSYDIKFKQRVIEYREEGHTFKETCKVFKISETVIGGSPATYNV
ncbi:IS630 transposase-related protein [Romboutsia ilealis]